VSRFNQKPPADLDYKSAYLTLRAEIKDRLRVMNNYIHRIPDNQYYMGRRYEIKSVVSIFIELEKEAK